MDVKHIYDHIASEFNHTRFSRWRGVKAYLDGLNANTVIADIGCGNGKYIGYRNDIMSVGVDVCEPLLRCIPEAPLLVQTDAFHSRLPFRDNLFDHVICIAMLHHGTSLDIRKRTFRDIIRIIRSGGTACVCVWATSAKKDTWTELNATGDVLVPWKSVTHTYQRFYHLFTEKECMDLIEGSNVTLKELYLEHDNWYIICSKVNP